MTRECERLGGLNLGQGICDLPTPPLVRDGALDAIRGGKATYSYPEGIPELRQKIAAKLVRDNQLEADPDSQIVVTAGSAGAFTCALFAALDPGDGILLLEPFYGYHLNAARLAGLDTHYLRLEAPGFRLEEEALLKQIREDVEVGLRGFDHQDVRAFFQVEAHFSQCFTPVGRVHLIRASVAELRSRFGCVAERAVECARKLCRVREDCDFFKAMLIERRANCGDASVHHVGRSDNVSARSRMGERCRCEPFNRRIVLHNLVRDDATVAVIGVLAKTYVGDDTEFGDAAFHGLDRTLHDSVVRVRAAAHCVFRLGNAKQDDTGHTEVVDPLRFVDDLIDRIAQHPGHRYDFFSDTAAFDHEQGQDEIVA